MSRIIVFEQPKIKHLCEADSQNTIYCIVYTRHSWYQVVNIIYDGLCIRRVRELDTFVTEFDKGLWSDTVEHMTVYSKENVVVTFKDGTEI